MNTRRGGVSTRKRKISTGSFCGGGFGSFGDGDIRIGRFGDVDGRISHVGDGNFGHFGGYWHNWES